MRWRLNATNFTLSVQPILNVGGGGGGAVVGCRFLQQLGVSVDCWADTPCWERAGLVRARISPWACGLGCTQEGNGRLTPCSPALVQARVTPPDGLLVSTLLAVHLTCLAYKGRFAVPMNIRSGIVFAETADVRRASQKKDDGRVAERAPWGTACFTPGGRQGTLRQRAAAAWTGPNRNPRWSRERHHTYEVDSSSNFFLSGTGSSDMTMRDHAGDSGFSFKKDTIAVAKTSDS